MDFPLIIKHKNLTIKLFNWMGYPKGQAARNVEAFDQGGNRVWTIESLGEMAASDFYTDIRSNGETLTAFNFQCYTCIIDEHTGKILSKSFTK